MDLKLVNVLIGIICHASSFPCTWYSAHKNSFGVWGEYRTFHSCLKNYNAWRISGSKKANAKHFENFTNLPVNCEDENLEIIRIIPPPELHLMLVVINRLYNYMLKEFEQDALQWTKECNVPQELWHGGLRFAGNACVFNTVPEVRSMVIRLKSNHVFY